MALKSSGKLTLGGAVATEAVAAELNKNPTALITLNDADVRTLAGIPSGRIRFPLDFYGKSFDINATVTFPGRAFSGYQSDIIYDYDYQSFVVHPDTGEVYIFGGAGLSELNYGWYCLITNHFYVQVDSSGNVVRNQYYLISGVTYNYDYYNPFATGIAGTGIQPCWGEANMVDSNSFVYFSGNMNGSPWIIKWNGVTGSPTAAYKFNQITSPANSSFYYSLICNVVDRNSDMIYSLIEDYGAIIFGFTVSTTGNIIITKMNAAGSLVWKYSYSRKGANQTDCIRTNSTGSHIYVALGGANPYIGGDAVLRIERIDSNGDWVNGINFPAPSYSDQGWATWGGRVTLSLDSSDNVYALMLTKNKWVNGAGNGAFSVVKMNSALSITWQKLLTGPYSVYDPLIWGGYFPNYAFNLLCANDSAGNLYIVLNYYPGYQVLEPYVNAFYIIKMDSSGNKLWEKKLTSDYGNSYFNNTSGLLQPYKLWIQGSDMYIAGITQPHAINWPGAPGTTADAFLTNYFKLPTSGNFNGPTTYNDGTGLRTYTWTTTTDWTLSTDTTSSSAATAPTRSVPSVSVSTLGTSTTSGSVPVVGNIPSN